MIYRKVSFFGNMIKMSFDSVKMEKRLIGQKKIQNAEGIDRITIYSSNVDIEVTISESSDIEVGLYSYTDTNAKVTFETKQEMNEYIVRTKFDSSNFFGNPILNVAIPVKKKFSQIKVDGTSSDVKVVDLSSVNGIDVKTNSGDVTIQNVSTTEGIRVETGTGDVEINKNVSTSFIEVETRKGDIEIHKHVSVKKLKITTHTGDVETKAKFQSAVVMADKGDVELKTHAMSDIDLDVTTTTGDVEIRLENVGTINISPKTKSGDIDFEHVDRGGFTAKLNVTTGSGDIEIS